MVNGYQHELNRSISNHFILLVTVQRTNDMRQFEFTTKIKQRCQVMEKNSEKQRDRSDVRKEMGNKSLKD